MNTRIAVLVLALLAVGVVGCSEDMVEQASYQAQEAPRRHSPPSSIPRNSRKIASPLPVAFGGKNAEAVQLFTVNCRHCHGDDATGDGPVAGFLKEQPKNLHAPHVQKKSEQEIYDVLTEGHHLMPSFKRLLSAEERRLLARYVAALPEEGRDRDGASEAAPTTARSTDR